MATKFRVQNYFPYLRNKYILILLFFIIWVLFFDDASIFRRISAGKKLRQLEAQKELMIKDLDESKKKYEDIQGDKDAIERYAREQYLMKKSNEVIYIVKEDD